MASRESITADKQELHEVIMRYCRAIDRKEYDLLRTVYHPDAIDAHGDYFHGDVEALIENCRKSLDIYSITTHAITNAYFKVEGDYAEGETYVLATHLTREEPVDTIVMSARYLDKFERRKGEWKIIYRNYCIDWSNKGDVDPHGPKGSDDANDPSYKAVPLLAAWR